MVVGEGVGWVGEGRESAGNVHALQDLMAASRFVYLCL